jgi:predicted RNA-binding Zn ribbon-like protein
MRSTSPVGWVRSMLLAFFTNVASVHGRAICMNDTIYIYIIRICEREVKCALLFGERERERDRERE